MATDQPEINMFFQKLSAEGKQYLQQLEEDAAPFIEDEKRQLDEFGNWLSSVFREAKKQQKSPDQKDESKTQ